MSKMYIIGILVKNITCVLLESIHTYQLGADTQRVIVEMPSGIILYTPVGVFSYIPGLI